MIKIAICDDEEKELHRTRELCESCLSAFQDNSFKVSLFDSSKELLNQILNDDKYDILLMDIYMPEITGVEAARILMDRNEPCQIIFLTTSTTHAVEAFSLHATHYLVKPYTLGQLADALSKAVRAVNRNRSAQLILKVAGGVQKVNYHDLVYSETERHMQNLHLTNHKEIQVRMSSHELFEKLSEDMRFYKCGSTYIINLEKVEEITTRQIVFENGDKIPMLRRQYRELLERYTGFSLGGIEYD